MVFKELSSYLITFEPQIVPRCRQGRNYFISVVLEGVMTQSIKCLVPTNMADGAEEPGLVSEQEC